VAAQPDLPILAFASPAEWEAWLDEHHASSDGVWVKFAKKASGIPTVVYAEALEVALCHGWIDGQVKRFDEDWYLQRFTPRRARSRWSQINRDKAEALIAAGRMRPAGLAEVERARADGRWDAAYASPSAITVPDDLRAALDADPAAREAFAGLSSQNRYAILYRVHDAKRPETRARRIAQFVAMLAEGRTPHP
jgi:uncharacterized protein YdeI (YjbR/CyaY-like superfamily)